MAELILISGGCRSGKSNYAETILEKSTGSKLYIATAPILDNEMAERIKTHQLRRKGKNWNIFEEEINLKDAILKNKNYNNILIDCLTLWINNLMYQAEQINTKLTEKSFSIIVTELLNSVKNIDSQIIFIINEVGMGIVPENKVTRLFRDLSGRCAQQIAAQANKVILMSCGLPLILKHE